MSTVSTVSRVGLVVLRVMLGWHLFVQGYGKVASGTWSSAGYLATATGPLAPWFRALAAHDTWLRTADSVVIWGLLITGGLLLLGACTRIAAASGAVLVLLFYLAHPPVAAGIIAPTAAGTEWIVNGVLIEMIALLVIATFPTGRWAGLDVLIEARRASRQDSAHGHE